MPRCSTLLPRFNRFLNKHDRNIFPMACQCNNCHFLNSDINYNSSAMFNRWSESYFVCQETERFAATFAQITYFQAAPFSENCLLTPTKEVLIACHILKYTGGCTAQR